MKRTTAAWREAFVRRMPEPLRRRFGPAASYLHMLVFDHLWVRLAYTNKRQLADGAWRSAQPLPFQIRRYARQGIRTIVNLRGRTKTSTYHIEKRATAAAGITMIDFAMKSRAAPTRESIRAARDLILSVEHPVLFHCKSGADRAGLMSALYLHFKHGIPIEDARSQLALRFGHIRQADTGILDEVLDRYVAESKTSPIDFMEWVETRYDPDEIERSFSSKSWANRLVRGLLRRE
jgi:protein tyrosine/serine phosphatase